MSLAYWSPPRWEGISGGGSGYRASSGLSPLLDGGGEMGERIRAFDWVVTPLGPPGAWPQALKTLVNLLLASRQPMFLAWGPKRTWIYNDSFTPILDHKHPVALGHPAWRYGQKRARFSNRRLTECLLASRSPLRISPMALIDRAGSNRRTWNSPTPRRGARMARSRVCLGRASRPPLASWRNVARLSTPSDSGGCSNVHRVLSPF
jgi:hypothetical protein